MKALKIYEKFEVLKGPDISEEELFRLFIDSAIKGDFQTFEDILDTDIDVNKQDKHGRTVLMYATDYSRYWFVSELLRNGANPNIKDNDGYDAYWYAKMQSEDSIKSLLDQYKLKRKKSIKEEFNVLKGPSEEQKRKVIIDIFGEDSKYANMPFEEINNNIYAYEEIASKFYTKSKGRRVSNTYKTTGTKVYPYDNILYWKIRTKRFDKSDHHMSTHYQIWKLDLNENKVYTGAWSNYDESIDSFKIYTQDKWEIGPTDDSKNMDSIFKFAKYMRAV